MFWVEPSSSRDDVEFNLVDFFKNDRLIRSSLSMTIPGLLAAFASDWLWLVDLEGDVAKATGRFGGIEDEDDEDKTDESDEVLASTTLRLVVVVAVAKASMPFRSWWTALPLLLFISVSKIWAYYDQLKKERS